MGADPAGVWVQVVLVTVENTRRWLCRILFVVSVVVVPPVGSDVPGRRGGGCWCSCRGLFAFLLIICVLHVAVFGVSSYYMKKIQARWCGGGSCRAVGAAGVRFLLKKRTKKRKHENV